MGLYVRLKGRIGPP